MNSDRRSPSHDPENPIPPASSTPPPEKSTPKVRSPERETNPTLPSPALSPLRQTDGPNALPLALPPPPPHNTPEHRPPSPSAPVVATDIASRLTRDDLAIVAKAVGGGGADVRGVIRGGGGGAAPRGQRGPSVPRDLRWGKVAGTAIGLRVAAAVLCLIAFSVMAADKTHGWDGDSYDRYEQYRFLVGVNVIGFVYSGSQACAMVVPRRHVMNHGMRYYFDLFMDQMLAYLVMSASSAAASINDIWVSRFGRDDFTRMASASIAMSFLAFMALALSSVISAYNLFSLLA